MKNTKIYRIQDKDGRGPWRPRFSHKWVIDRADLENLKPFFLEFPSIQLKRGCGSGCRTLVQLRRWFVKDEYTTLIQYGYNAVEIYINEILAESEFQVVFYRDLPFHKDVHIVELYDEICGLELKGK